MVVRKSPVRITASFIAAIPLAESSANPVFFWDDQLKGFGIKVTATGKKYIAETKVNRKTVRVTIDAHNVISVEEARKQARVLLGQMHGDKNPNAKRRADSNRDKTFSDICRDYLDTKELKPLTRRDYERHIAKTFADWQSKPFLNISSDMVVQTYRKNADRQIVRGGLKRKVSAAQANQAFRFARAVFRFAKRFRDEEGKQLLWANPVDVLGENSLWRRVNERTNTIKRTELRSLWKAIWSLENDARSQDRETIRDFLVLILFTGLRLGEARDLQWRYVDLQEGTLTIPAPKNHKEHVLPLSDYLWSFLRHRKETAGDSAWVFPAARKDGIAPIIEFRKTITAVCTQAGVSFTPHDLRRTFLSYAENVPGKFSAFFTKRLANHTITDVTGKYIIISLEDLRLCMQQITDYILENAKAKSTRIGFFQPPAPAAPQQRRVRIRRTPLQEVLLRSL